MEQLKKKIFLKHCPLCDNSDFEPYLSTKDYFLTLEIFELVRCKSCEFVFTNPIPALDDLAAYYDSPDYLSHDVSKKSLVGTVYNSLRETNLRNKFKLISKFKNPGKILDIGQGTGEFLNYMKNRGWDVTGIEPNDSARKFAIDHYQLNVLQEEDINRLPEKSFDVISLWHVMEHVPDLNLRMQQIKDLIAEKGILVIAVPNLDAPDAKKYGEKWAALDVPRHLYHFTRATMNILLEKFGFELINSYPMKLDAFYVSLLSERYLNNKFPYPAAFLNGLKSNMAAGKENNYSSMIFVAKQK